MINTRGVLAIGTIIVVLNVIFAIAAVTFVEMLLGDFEVRQKLVVLDQGNRIKCSAIIRESTNDEYSRRSDELDSLASVRMVEFYGEPSETDYKSETAEQSDNIDVTVCGDTFKEIIECESDLNREMITLISCQAPTYHPEFTDSRVKVIVQKDAE